MTAELSPIGQLPVDYNAVLKHLGLNGSDPRSQAVVLVCQRYNLDPVLKHVVLVDGSVYVTRDGLLHVAHQTGQFDGMDVEEATYAEDRKEWRARATVYRKDMSRGVSFSGHYPAGKKNAREMAEKVAVARSLRHAFDVAIATEDERQGQQGQDGTTARRVTVEEITGQSAPVSVEQRPADVDENGVLEATLDETGGADPATDGAWPEAAQPGSKSGAS